MLLPAACACDQSTSCDPHFVQEELSAADDRGAAHSLTAESLACRQQREYMLSTLRRESHTTIFHQHITCCIQSPA